MYDTQFTNVLDRKSTPHCPDLGRPVQRFLTKSIISIMLALYFMKKMMMIALTSKFHAKESCLKVISVIQYILGIVFTRDAKPNRSGSPLDISTKVQV